jgi:Rrf2 family protein
MRKAQQIGSNPDKCSGNVHGPDIRLRCMLRSPPGRHRTNGPPERGRCTAARPVPIGGWKTGSVRISARADYALRAAVELAAAGGGPVKLEQLASGQDLPPKFLETILGELRRAGLLRTQRGADGGYWLARPSSAITLADVIRVADGPLADVRGVRPESGAYGGHAAALAEVWVAVRAAVRAVLEQVSLADVAEGRLPDVVADLTRDDDAWVPH